MFSQQQVSRVWRRLVANGDLKQLKNAVQNVIPTNQVHLQAFNKTTAWVSLH